MFASNIHLSLINWVKIKRMFTKCIVYSLAICLVYNPSLYASEVHSSGSISNEFRINVAADLYYGDNDISTYIDSVLQQTAARLSGYTYLLSDTVIDREDNQEYIVAVSDAIDTEGASTKLEYFIDKSTRPKDTKEEILGQLLTFNGSQQPAYNELMQKIEVIRSDGLNLEFVHELLEGMGENVGEIYDKFQNELDQLRQAKKDIFDELHQLNFFNTADYLHLKILFPYNMTQWHWLTGEIRIHKKEEKDNFIVHMFAHDPYGKGEMSATQFITFAVAITKRIKEICGANSILFFENVESPYGPRQDSEDSISCGVIAVEDLISRITGTPLRVNPYPWGANELRVAHIETVRGVNRGANPEARFINRNDNRVRYIARTQTALEPLNGEDMESYVVRLREHHGENSGAFLKAVSEYLGRLREYHGGNRETLLKDVSEHLVPSPFLNGPKGKILRAIMAIDEVPVWPEDMIIPFDPDFNHGDLRMNWGADGELVIHIMQRMPLVPNTGAPKYCEMDTGLRNTLPSKVFVRRPVPSQNETYEDFFYYDNRLFLFHYTVHPNRALFFHYVHSDWPLNLESYSGIQVGLDNEPGYVYTTRGDLSILCPVFDLRYGNISVDNGELYIETPVYINIGTYKELTATTTFNVNGEAHVRTHPYYRQNGSSIYSKGNCWLVSPKISHPARIKTDGDLHLGGSINSVVKYASELIGNYSTTDVGADLYVTGERWLHMQSRDVVTIPFRNQAVNGNAFVERVIQSDYPRTTVRGKAIFYLDKLEVSQEREQNAWNSLNIINGIAHSSNLAGTEKMDVIVHDEFIMPPPLPQAPDDDGNGGGGGGPGGGGWRRGSDGGYYIGGNNLFRGSFGGFGLSFSGGKLSCHGSITLPALMEPLHIPGYQVGHPVTGRGAIGPLPLQVPRIENPTISGQFTPQENLTTSIFGQTQSWTPSASVPNQIQKDLEKLKEANTTSEEKPAEPAIVSSEEESESETSKKIATKSTTAKKGAAKCSISATAKRKRQSSVESSFENPSPKRAKAAHKETSSTNIVRDLTAGAAEFIEDVEAFGEEFATNNPKTAKLIANTFNNVLPAFSAATQGAAVVVACGGPQGVTPICWGTVAAVALHNIFLPRIVDAAGKGLGEGLHRLGANENDAKKVAMTSVAVGSTVVGKGKKSTAVNPGGAGPAPKLGKGNGARIEAAVVHNKNQLKFGDKLDFLFNKNINPANVDNVNRAKGNAERIGIAGTTSNRIEVMERFNKAFNDPTAYVGPGKTPGSRMYEFFMPGVTSTGSKMVFVTLDDKLITIIAK